MPETILSPSTLEQGVLIRANLDERQQIGIDLVLVSWRIYPFQIFAEIRF